MLEALSLVPTGPALASETDPASPNFGKKVFLWNALPGELITKYTVVKNKRSYCEAIAEEIAADSLSPRRVPPRDPCYLSTSPWQILSWDYELTQKRLLIEASLAQEHVPYICPISPVVTDNREWHYRNKMEYALYWDNSDNQIYLAFHQRGSHRKLPLSPRLVASFRGCAQPRRAQERDTRNGGLARLGRENGNERKRTYPSSIERPEIAEKALKIVQELNSTGGSARDYQSLLLRANQQGIVSGGLLPNGQPHPTFPNLTDTILGHSYSYSVSGFFQINLPVYELALTEIRRHIVSDNVLDLYSGVGTIGLSVAADKNLTLVESNPAAFAELEHNVEGLKVRPVFCKSEDALDFITPNQTVILDPPRAGCDKKLIERLASVVPEKIIYLSCNPSTQARDLRLLLSSVPYSITSITPFNFFPKTPHIENLVILDKQ